MGEISDIIKLGVEYVRKAEERRQAVEKNSWDDLITIVDGLYELLPQHEKAIESVVSFRIIYSPQNDCSLLQGVKE